VGSACGFSLWILRVDLHVDFAVWICLRILLGEFTRSSVFKSCFQIVSYHMKEMM